jgi:hypothetical protein
MEKESLKKKATEELEGHHKKKAKLDIRSHVPAEIVHLIVIYTENCKSIGTLVRYYLWINLFCREKFALTSVMPLTKTRLILTIPVSALGMALGGKKSSAIPIGKGF